MAAWAAVVRNMRGLPYVVISFGAVALLLPAILGAPMVHESFWIDIVWSDQFTALLKSGTLYPRWLPQSYDGLGAPIFYFYPPLAFYVTGFFGVIGLENYPALIAAFWLVLSASGWTMYRWLLGWTERPMIAALLYMAAPYHMLDFYKRGALAEFAAFALLPLLALGLRRVREGGSPMLLALAYAALILTHLPAAVIVSLLFAAPYAAHAVLADRKTLFPFVAGFGIGIGLTAIYLLPMLLLREAVSIQYMLSYQLYQTTSWSLLMPELWPSTPIIMQFFVMYALIVFAAAFMLIANRREPWAWSAVGTCAVVAGLLPGFWSLPIVSNVQFPWRGLMLVEFLLFTAFARANLKPVVATFAILPMLTLSAATLRAERPAYTGLPPDWQRRHLDIREYVPAGAPDESNLYAGWAMALSKQHRAPMRDGEYVVGSNFYFPAWQVTCDGQHVPTSPDPATRLLRWQGKNCIARIVTTAAEKLGLAISLLSLLLLVALVLRRRIKPPALSAEVRARHR